uniref:Small ribosomal subunit protein mS26 n=1 Tax=Evadne anonyx TaxID=141404 RepID=A0A9N6WQL6_9CRUS|nr:EOG090X0FQ9 [Evadne anonyx]
MFTLKSGINISKSLNQFYVPKRGKRVWQRKPMGGPPAPSKLFRIPVKPFVPEDEKAEQKRLLDNYRSQMKALRQYFFEQSLKQAVSGESAQLKLKEEDIEHERLMEENLIENKKTALLREERLKAEFETTREKVLQSLMKKEKEQALYQEKLCSFIKEQEATPFISKDEVERAIEEALSNPVNFNFAIDFRGNVYSDAPNEFKRDENKLY